jgi:hypothetical protein
VPIKNMGEIEIREILRRGMHLRSQSAEQRAREALEAIEQAGRYCCGRSGRANRAEWVERSKHWHIR